MRALFTVALLVATAAVVLPAVEAAGVDRADAQTRGSVDRLVAAARTLAASNGATADRAAAARVTVVLPLPREGFASAPLATLTVGPTEDGDVDGATRRDSGAATRVAWRVEGGRRHVVQVDGLRLRSPGGGRFRLARGGRRRFVLRLVERDGVRVVTLSRRGSHRPRVEPAAVSVPPRSHGDHGPVPAETFCCVRPVPGRRFKYGEATSRGHAGTARAVAGRRNGDWLSL